MSFDAFVWAWDQKLAKDEHLIILLALANIANENNEIYAGQPYIAAMARKEERTVRRALVAMLAMDPPPISARARPGTTDVITLNVPDEFTVRRKRPPEGKGKRGRPPKTLDTTALNPGHGDGKPPSKVSDEPIEGTSKGTQEANASVGGADDVRLAFNAFNATMIEIGSSPAKALNDDRRRRIRARLKDCGGLEGWCAQMKRIPGSAFLTGQTHHHYGLTLDTLIQPSTFTKLVEGFYHDRSQTDARRDELARPVDRGAARANASFDAMVDGGRETLDRRSADRAEQRRRWGFSDPAAGHKPDAAGGVRAALPAPDRSGTG